MKDAHSPWMGHKQGVQLKVDLEWRPIGDVVIVGACRCGRFKGAQYSDQ